MLTFRCNACNARLFFENVACLACGHAVAFDPASLSMCTLDSALQRGLQQCRNWREHAACNWLAAASRDLCASCVLDEIVPDLASPRRRELWIATEAAKRRLVFTLLRMQLPLDAPPGKQSLRFRLLADERAETGAVDLPAGEPSLTGHDTGCLSVNVVEADDGIRETMRSRFGERYRTMLGHLRHEIGHYYWYTLVADTDVAESCRAIFGDERVPYQDALSRYYAQPPPTGWEGSFVSAYATMHPWEDFAETWAHYIHIVDTLETAADAGVAIEGSAVATPLPFKADRLIDSVRGDWVRLTVALNQLNRSMGMSDAYPFALSDAVVAKLRFVYQLCRTAAHPRGDSVVV
jgi:hypothetical protein